MDTSTLRPASGQANSPTSLARVPFRGGFIEAAQLDGEVWVPLRPLCDRLGVSYSRQLKKVSAAPWAVVAQKATTGTDGKTYRMACLDLRSLPGWLFGLNASKVAPEARPALLAYQREAADVLYRHFLAPPVPVEVPTLPGTIEAARIEGLEARVRKLEAKARKPAGEPAPLGVGSRLNEEDAARVRAYCETRPVVAAADAMREALGLTTWTNVEASALAAELRELGYERRKTYLARGCQKWRWRRVNTSPLSLVSFRPDAPAQLAGGCA